MPMAMWAACATGAGAGAGLLRCQVQAVDPSDDDGGDDADDGAKENEAKPLARGIANADDDRRHRRRRGQEDRRWGK